MQQLKLNETDISDENIADEPRKTFWRRQFQIESTRAQRKFDWFFGVIMPVICFVFDPIVFKGSGFGTALLGTYKPFAYLLSFVSVMAMSAWLIWGVKLKWLNAFLAGFFLVGGIVSLSIGVVLFPFSLMGLIILIGVLGFTPLFSSIVFFRNAFRSFQTAKPFFESGVLIRSFVITAIFSTVIPAIINVEIKRMMDEMLNGDAETIHARAQILKYVAPITNFDALTFKYSRSRDPQFNEETKALTEEYKNLAGEGEYNHR